ncbi:hypothetical protein BDN70DRAFT_889030 [Pholiota conissans]|uniref:Helicase ATP-binding domain-containing protein n=1 Tax=Pholiota conissans TaxID=109636 RepID=A0A9P5YMD9_9AGAR|nr:hypothetical protein BDN70DRAFT_889030 [Pholiota conissans]
MRMQREISQVGLSMVVRNPVFKKNLVFLVIDDAHILYPWGKDFRKAYRQIALLHRRLPAHIGLVAVTAALSDGDDYHSLCSQSNLKEGHFKCIRFWSECPNIRIICKELTYTLGGSEFSVGIPCISGAAKWLLDVLAGVVKWRFRGFVGS